MHIHVIVIILKLLRLTTFADLYGSGEGKGRHKVSMPLIISVLFLPPTSYLLYEKLSEEFRTRVHIFSTFFYTRLSNASMDDKASK